MSIALLCPGQGAQEPGFLHALTEHVAVARVIAEASEVLGQNVLELDAVEALKSTVAVQLGLLVAGVAFARFLEAEGVQLEAAAGMSVGAFSAAVAAGALTFESALTLVRRRAQLMEEAMPAGWGMAVVEGLREGAVRRLIEGTTATIANYNSATQFVLAGQVKELVKVVERGRAAGAFTAKVLGMSTASHTRALATAAKTLDEFAQGCAMQNARIPVFSNRTARAQTQAAAIREDLSWNMAEPVRWYDVTTALAERGVTLFVEAPPGHMLTRLARETSPSVRAMAGGEVRWDIVLRECLR